MKTVHVGDVAEQLRGVTFSKADAVPRPREGYIAVLTAGNIQDGMLVTSDLTYVPADKVRAKQQVRANDVVICASSGSLSVVGKAAQCDGSFAGGFGAFLKVLRPGPDVEPRYFAHFFQTQTYRRTISALAAGANINNLKNEHLDDLVLPLPPILEQRRIAAILDHSDALRAKRRQVLTHLDALSQSIFREMFGDPVFNPRGIPTAAIGALANVVTGNSPSRADADNFGESIEWIKSDNLGGNVATLADEWLSEQGRTKARSAPAGSILVTCIAGSPTSIGKASLVDRDVAFNQQINAILPSPMVDAAFLLGQLKTAPELVRAKSTGGMKGLVNKSAFQSIEVLAPSVEAQQTFASRVAAVARQADAGQRALAADDELFAALQSRAFRGEL